MSLSLELMILSGMVLLAVNAVTNAPGASGSNRLFMIWGISLPALVTYLSSLALRGDLHVLLFNALVLLLAYAWALWVLRACEKAVGMDALSRSGPLLSLCGLVIFIGTWGWFTLGDWPMMPYLSYMWEKPLLYVGLGLGYLGPCLFHSGREVPFQQADALDTWYLQAGSALAAAMLLLFLFKIFAYIIFPFIMLVLAIHWMRTLGTPPGLDGS